MDTTSPFGFLLYPPILPAARNVGSGFFSRFDHFDQIEKRQRTISESGDHCRSGWLAVHSRRQRAMRSNEIVVNEMQGNRARQIQLPLAETIRLSREAAHVRAHGQILPLYKRCTDMRRVGIPLQGNWRPFDFWNVTRFLFGHAVLPDLRVIDLAAKTRVRQLRGRS